MFLNRVKTSPQDGATLLAGVTHYSLCPLTNISQLCRLLPFETLKPLTALNRVHRCLWAAPLCVCTLTSIGALHPGHVSKWLAINPTPLREPEYLSAPTRVGTFLFRERGCALIWVWADIQDISSSTTPSWLPSEKRHVYAYEYRL